jgi:HlyD family secretion protein
MSSGILVPPFAPKEPGVDVPLPPSPPARKSSWRWRPVLIGVLMCLTIAGAAWLTVRTYQRMSASKAVVIPTAVVQRGDVSLSVTAKGALSGGSPEVLTAPLTGGMDMHIIAMKPTGAEIKAGELVVQFDTTEQEYKLKEAQGDLAEAEQHIVQARAQKDADEEEDRYALLKAKADLALAELDVRKNPILAAIVAKQNDLALQAARDHLTQLEQNLSNRKATNDAAISMQEAGRGKAESQATTAKQNIEAMSLRAHADGYVAIKPNMSGSFFFDGVPLPPYQVGDLVRPGQAVIEIPDLKNWQLTAKLGELDRGHISKGDAVEIKVIAVPDHKFTGHVKDLGGMMGSFWDRRFECNIGLDNPTPDLRPGMSVQIVITTELLRNALWLPAQALFESDGKTFVYTKSGDTFVAKDVKLVRRNETRVVIEGLAPGQVVALANPTEMQKTKAAGGALQSLPK